MRALRSVNSPFKFFLRHRRAVDTRHFHLPRVYHPAGQVHLTDRALVSLSGRDASRFLQGLTTANIPESFPEIPRAIYSTFLNAQGRILHDVFIYSLPSSSGLLDGCDPSINQINEPIYLIEVDSSEVENLLKWLKKYKLRSNIALRALEHGEVQVLGVWNDSDTMESLTSAFSGRLISPDSRAPSFGHRVLFSPSFPKPLEIEKLPTLPLDSYRLRRYMWGIPEGQAELCRATALVHDSCIDYMGGVDFRKGCYIGQELVIRTQHTGVVRKRILPCLLHNTDQMPTGLNATDISGMKMGDDIPYGTDIITPDGSSQRKRSLGKWIAGVGNVGLALCRLENMVGLGPTGDAMVGWNGGTGFILDLETFRGSSNIRVKPLVPSWWNERKDQA